ncbi:hypothetical protein ACFSYG_08590 [Leeuwenhoekiella polynyae]|uniref:Uncharacterized protein n=2 Tax=Leeuwenhoekiella polynyae TaxID=1550906 RepID=A0A4Q0NQM1_9FLAO|nr:hypothetical protein DSM02_3966 [Leeuwenhoekiella polynyae]
MDYLNEEIVLARKKADEQAILMAKEYAKDPYLKYFRAPRFIMPTVKLDIPIKINELDSQTKYEFKMDEDVYFKEVNNRISKVNKEKNLAIQPISKETLKSAPFKKIVNELEKPDDKFVRKIDEKLVKIDFQKPVLDIVKIRGVSVSDTDKDIEKDEISTILKDSLKKMYTPTSAKLNNIFFDPDTSKETDKDKILLTLKVEMVEEGIQIIEATNAEGKTIEEIIF